MQPAIKEKVFRSVLSLFATLAGWIAAFGAYVLYMNLMQQRLTDVPAVLFLDRARTI